MRRKDLLTFLPKDETTTVNQSPQLLKTDSIDEKSETNIHPHLKRPKLDSTSSEPGSVSSSNVEPTPKRSRLEQIDESSPRTMETNLITE